MSGKYDNFAEEYSKSQGENGDFFHKTQIDPFIYKIIGNPQGKKIYDIGCGNGYMARYFARHGAKVTASDLSQKLINISKEKNKELNIKYYVCDATDFSKLKSEKFDFIVLNMVINYIKNIDLLFKGVADSLKNNGLVVFSTNHPIRPAYPYSYWEKGEINGKEKLFIKMTNYLTNIKFKVKSGWDQKTQLELINRPFAEYVNILSKHGLYLMKAHEPESVGFAKDFSKKLQKSHHIPTFIIMGAIKKI